eukprot:CAMPEP_0118680590 /NCGR_PEP_ID=MMETSP0800-20121206/4450_1 /TAXON_ID=210618 ORGANISM="Striatella unipunctata, Strain CCMP2910" /NCGR_SAMPLE_ID=MMETSP0800 /ASSEMBLY_ACC=CAM_ASM_000638 /LENGTH=172 /DNA_ID=CAMNT_0006576757 /DNA_START=325 /DNA_END=843 /DNA_ORIENTATION=-
MDGNVFGCFTSSPWRRGTNGFYGSGEAFLWKLALSRFTPCDTPEQQADLERNVIVHAWSGKNRNVQFVGSAFEIRVGSGPPDDDNDDDNKENDDCNNKNGSFGFGLAMEQFLDLGTSSECATFSSPPLVEDGTFAIANLEVWALTPVTTLDMAEKLELGRQFIFDHGHFVHV